jgi:hypothetical protein
MFMQSSSSMTASYFRSEREVCRFVQFNRETSLEIMQVSQFVIFVACLNVFTNLTNLCRYYYYICKITYIVQIMRQLYVAGIYNFL